MADIKAELQVPYGKTAAEAKEFTLTIKPKEFATEYSTTCKVNLAEAGDLLRQLATGLKAHRDALAAQYGQSLDEAVADLTRSLPE